MTLRNSADAASIADFSLAASLSDSEPPAQRRSLHLSNIAELARHNNSPNIYAQSIMGVFKTLSKVAAYGTVAGAGGWAVWTRNSNFVPLSPSDYIYNTTFYARNNPERNPATADLCVRKVPLSQIKPEYLEKEGKLVEKFCAGVWGGLGEYSGFNAYPDFTNQAPQDTPTSANTLRRSIVMPTPSLSCGTPRLS